MENKDSRDGLLAHLRKSNGSGETYDGFHPDFKKAFNDLIESKPQYTGNARQIWMGLEGIKSLHKGLGDDRFYKLLDEVGFTTSSAGADYINNFVDDYEN